MVEELLRLKLKQHLILAYHGIHDMIQVMLGRGMGFLEDSLTAVC